MAMLIPVSGTFNFLAFGDATLTEVNEVILECDTSTAPVTIILPKISSLGGQLTFRVKINDASNNSGVNPITINTFSGDFFIGSQTQVIINGNGSTGECVMFGQNKWTFYVGESLAAFYTSRVVLHPPDVYALDTIPFVLVHGIPDKIIKPLSLVGTINFNSVAYSTAQFVNATFNAFNGVSCSPAFTTALIAATSERIEDVTFTAIQAIKATVAYSDYLGQSWELIAPSPITLGDSDITVDFQYELISQP